VAADEQVPGTDLTGARRLFEGSVAVVTGAGSGLGAGFAEVAASLGMRVVLADVDARRLEAVEGRIGAVEGMARRMVTDVRRYEEVQALADWVFAEGEHVGLLVNNAGVEHVGPVWEVPPEDWHRVVGVNLHGVYHGVRAFVPAMMAAVRRSVVLNVASVGALTAGADHGAYEVTKHGVLVLSEALADGLSAAGAPVQVSVALPGPVRTRIYEDANPATGAGAADDRVAAMRRLLAEEGMAPLEAARTMLAQVAAGAFWVTTHPDMLRALAERRAERLSGLAQTVTLL
jgi:NAD(P)-dependent dehydrogenase (short-subunit alcohol dehydrogenase family)